jgi:DnaK suppressor protein
LISVNNGLASTAHDGVIYTKKTRKPLMSTQQQTAPFKKQLLERQAALQEQLNSLRGGDKSRAEASADHFNRPEDSTAQTNTARDLEFALDEHETLELAQVAAALGRIEAGTYGQCVDCGVEIPAKRLHVAPAAARCIACQEKTE